MKTHPDPLAKTNTQHIKPESVDHWKKGEGERKKEFYQLFDKESGVAHNFTEGAAKWTCDVFLVYQRSGDAASTRGSVLKQGLIFVMVKLNQWGRVLAQRAGRFPFMFSLQLKFKSTNAQSRTTTKRHKCVFTCWNELNLRWILLIEAQGTQVWSIFMHPAVCALELVVNYNLSLPRNPALWFIVNKVHMSVCSSRRQSLCLMCLGRNWRGK